MRQIVAACVAVLLCGCASVYSLKPVGEEPTNIESAQEEWEGTWTDNHGWAITVKVADPANGVLRVGWFKYESGDLKPQIMDVHLRDSAGWTFASFKHSEQDDQGHYLWVRIRKERRMAILWGPDVKEFGDLVSKGKLPGSFAEKSVYLAELGANELALIRSESEGVLFDWDRPMVLIKLSK